jgi:Mrp family chromosome partitioning ATPase
MQFTELLHSDPLGTPSAIAALCRQLTERRSSSPGPRIILTTSAIAGEGKSLLAASTAASLCTSGAKVFLMECNPAAPSLVDWFPQAENFSAMASDLSALRYGLSNLFILPGHDLPSIDMAELLPGYRHWLERAVREVEWIIIDCASLLMGFADVSKLVPYATDILFIHDDTRCTPEQVKAALNLLRPLTSPDRIRGMVMNRHSLVTA